MGNHFVKINEVASLEQLMERSKEQAIVIFKHSTTCAMSASAFREMQRFQGEVALVEVQYARALSGEIANRTGVAHESPQVIVLRHGKAVWNASHFQVKSEAVAEAVRAASRDE